MTAIISTFLVTGSLATTPVNATSRDRAVPSLRADAIARLQNLGVPSELLSILAADQMATFTGSFVDVIPAADLDRDGRDDVVAGYYRYEITINDPSDPLSPLVEEKVYSRLRALSGRDGSTIWRKNYDSFIWPVTARVGERARAGMYMLHGLTTWTGPIGDRELRIDALEGATGRRIWRQSYESVTSEGDATLYVGVPTGIDIFNGLPGKQTEVLVGVSDVAGSYSAYVSRTTTLVLHGADGRETTHPAQDVGVNWFTGPWAVGDVGGNRFDDYVVPSDKGVALPDDQSPPELGGIVTARTGTSGEDIWVEGGYDFKYLAWVYNLGDVVGDGHRDIGIVTVASDDTSVFFTFGATRFVTYLTDAGAGILRWRKPDGWPYSPGDIDRDGKAEVTTRDVQWQSRKGKIVYRQQSFNGRGHRLWRRPITRNYEAGSCQVACSAGYGAGWLEVGDFHRDGSIDTFVLNSIQQEPGEDRDFNFTVSGRTGRAVDSGGEELQAFGAALDGRGTDVVDVDASGTDLRLVARSGDRDRLLWRSELTFDTVFGPRASRRLASIKLDPDRCDDAIAIIDSPKAAIVVALDGGSGRVKWQRTVDGQARILSSSTSDHLRRC